MFLGVLFPTAGVFIVLSWVSNTAVLTWKDHGRIVIVIVIVIVRPRSTTATPTSTSTAVLCV